MKTKNAILSVALCGCLLLVGCGKNEDTSKITRDYMEYNNSVLAKNVDDFKDKMETKELFIDIKVSSKNPSYDLNIKLSDLRERYKDNTFTVETIIPNTDLESSTAIIRSIPNNIR